MPAPIVLQDQSGLAQGIAGAGSALSQALQFRNQQANQRQGLEAFQSGMESAQGDPNMIAKAYTQALASGADPAQLQGLSQAYQSARKQNAFKTAFDEAINMGGLDTDEGKQAFIQSFGREGGDPFQAMQFFKKDQKGETTFDKKINEFKANAVIDYIGGGSDASKNLKENLDYLEGNLKNVGRAKGLATGEFLWSGQEFTEFRNRGNLALDGVIKVFNKAGVLPQKKLEWIRETFSVSPMDTQDQIQGKINALRTLTKDASAFDEGLGGLIDKYGENIPTREFLNLQRNVTKSFDKFEQEMASPQKEQVYQKLPTSGISTGAEATDTETGQKFIWNGSRWIKQK